MLGVLLIIGGISKAYEANVWLGLVVTLITAAVTVLGVYGLMIASAPGPPPAGDPEGPRDWAPAEGEAG